VIWLLAGGGCEAPPLEVRATAEPTGVRVEATAPVSEVELVGDDGVPWRRLAVPGGAETVSVPLPPAGRWTVVARGGGRVGSVVLEVAAPEPVRVEVQTSPGGAWIAVPAEGASAPVPVIDGAPTEVLLAVTAGPTHPVEVTWSGGRPIPLDAPGDRELRTVQVAEVVDLTIGERRLRLEPRRIAREDLVAALSVGAPVFPADAEGRPETARARDRLRLPSALWRSTIRAVGLGTRVRDPWAPWGFVAVELAVAGGEPVDLVLSAEVTQEGAPDPAFRPRLRSGDGDTGVTRSLVRVRPGMPTPVALPVFVDEVQVRAGTYAIELRLTPLGSDTPLWTAAHPLHVQRGDGVAGAGLGVGVGVALAAAAWLARRVPGWLVARPTSELMTIALFGTAGFLVGSASDVLSIVSGAILGPFSTLAVGLLSDVGRTALHGTLLALFPRPGTLALAMLTSWLGRAFSTGGFSPVDILYVGVSVGFAEAFAWAAGLTRRPDWPDASPRVRWLRLATAFGGASFCTTLVGLWMHMVLYRLYFADWYLALQALVPGFLYVLVACALTVPFADALRKVRP